MENIKELIMYGDKPKQITNKADILQICRDYFQGNGKDKFFSRMHIKNEKENVIIEGCGVLGINTTDSDIFIDLTNGDSNYTASIGRVNFFDIQYIEEIN